MAEIPRAKLFTDPMPSAQYAVLHPVASQPDKTWPADRFLAVAGHLQNNFDLEPVFIGAAGDDLSPFRAYRTVAGAPLGTLKSLVARAVLFVGNDSGPAHMAAAFNVPAIVIFGSSDPVIWAPWRTNAEILTHPAGISAVPVEAAIEALGRLRVHV